MRQNAPKSNGFFATMLAESRDNVFAPNAFLRVAPDNTVTIISKHCEAGQGIHTGLATILAEELDADWAQIRVEPAPADRALYKNLQFGDQENGGSNSIPNSWEQYRHAGATARAMLMSAAAKRWNVPDIQTCAFRPMYLHRLTAGLDEQANLIAWQHRIVGQSVLGGDPSWLVDGVDITSVAGASNIPYDIPNILVDLHTPTSGIPVTTWRSGGDSHTAFSVETFLDDVVAHAVGKDPYQFRLELLSKAPRSKAILQLTAPAPMRPSLFAKFPRDRQVMQLAAEKAGWGGPLPPGTGRGLAVHDSFRASLAYVAEVMVAADGSIKVDRVVCAVDCGIAVNPDVIRAQVEGGVAFGLGAILNSTITLKQGRVEQSNFNDYRVLRMNEPNVEVYIVNSEEPPSGIGEPTVSPIGPAVSNAIFAATGKRVRTLPLGSAT
jgi:CO/xanthine dehydrogenase Mo-binding subunit